MLKDRKAQMTKEGFRRPIRTSLWMPTFALRRPHGGGYSAAMLDIHLIREKPDFVRERLATRSGGDEGKINEVLRADGERRKLETALQHLNAERRRLSKEIGAKRAASGQRQTSKPVSGKSATKLSILTSER